MLKEQKNKIFEIIRDSFPFSDISIDDFDIEKTSMELSDNASLISFKNSRLKFAILPKEDSYDYFRCKFNEFNPQFSTTPWIPENGYLTFDELKFQLNLWLREHVGRYLDELSTLDIWETYKSQSKIIDINKIGFTAEQKFTSEEKIKIKAGVQKLKSDIEIHVKLDPHQFNLIIEKLDYIANGPDRLDKFDWANITVSTIINIMTSVVLDGENRSKLFELFKATFYGMENFITTTLLP